MKFLLCSALVVLYVPFVLFLKSVLFSRAFRVAGEHYFVFIIKNLVSIWNVNMLWTR